MKNKTIKLIVASSLIFLLSGCVTRVQDVNKKPVTDPITGQTLTKNILCQPELLATKQLYAKNNVDITALPKCSALTISSNNYEGIWTTFFVRPLVWLLVQMGNLVKNYGLAIILTTLLIRTIMSPITKKSAEQSDKMKIAKPEIDAIEKKYKNVTDKNAMMQKSNEIAMVYKKHNIGIMSGCIFAVIQLPLFLAYYEAIVRLPAVFEETFLWFNLGTTPMKAITTGQYQYLIFVILVAAATYYSFKMTGAIGANKEQENSQKTMMTMMIVLIFVSSIFLPAGLALYWITNNAFTIGQNLFSTWRAK